jgi:hypothetical protein
MARIFCTGFEPGDLNIFEVLYGSPAIASGVEGFSGYCLHLGSSDYVDKLISPSLVEIWGSFLYKYTEYSGSRHILELCNGSTRLGGIYKESVWSNRLYCIKGGLGSTIVTSSLSLKKDQVYRLAFQYKPHASAGIWKVWINGILDIDFSGGTADSTVNVDRMRLGKPPAAYVDAYFDDLILDDAEVPDSSIVTGLAPTGAGNSTQWNAQPTPNWDAVNEIPASIADYLYINSVDQIDLFALADLPAEAEAVKALLVNVLCCKDGNPTPANLQVACRTGGSNYFGSNFAPSTNLKRAFKVWPLNPNTGVTWTVSEVNGLEIGVKSVT